MNKTIKISPADFVFKDLRFFYLIHFQKKEQENNFP